MQASYTRLTVSHMKTPKQSMFAERVLSSAFQGINALRKEIFSLTYWMLQYSTTQAAISLFTKSYFQEGVKRNKLYNRLHRTIGFDFAI